MRTFGALIGDGAREVLVQPDGKLVLAGYGGTDFAVARRRQMPRRQRPGPDGL